MPLPNRLITHLLLLVWALGCQKPEHAATDEALGAVEPDDVFCVLADVSEGFSLEGVSDPITLGASTDEENGEALALAVNVFKKAPPRSGSSASSVSAHSQTSNPPRPRKVPAHAMGSVSHFSPEVEFQIRPMSNIYNLYYRKQKTNNLGKFVVPDGGPFITDLTQKNLQDILPKETFDELLKVGKVDYGLVTISLTGQKFFRYALNSNRDKYVDHLLNEGPFMFDVAVSNGDVAHDVKTMMDSLNAKVDSDHAKNVGKLRALRALFQGKADTLEAEGITLGAGSFGAVYSFENFAVKKMKNTDSNRSELAALFDGSCPSCLNYFGAFRGKDGFIYLVSELGAKYQFAKSADTLPAHHMAFLGQQLVELEATGKVHLDLKLDNILWVERGGKLVPVIMDMGIVRREPSTIGGAGTPYTLSPEQTGNLTIDPAHASRIMVYALGIEKLKYFRPANGKRIDVYQRSKIGEDAFQAQVQDLVTSLAPKSPSEPQSTDYKTALVIQKMLAKDITERMSPQEMVAAWKDLVE